MFDARPMPKDMVRDAERVDDEWLVIDEARAEVHILSSQMYEALSLCDGRRTVREIAARLAEVEDVDLDGVATRIDALDSAGLLEWREGRKTARRKVLAAVAGLATLSIPGPAMAASCSGLLESCLVRPCCPGLGLGCVAGLCVVI